MPPYAPPLGIAAIAIHQPAWEVGNAWFGDAMPRKFAQHTGIEARGISLDDEVTMGLAAVRNLQRETGARLADCRGILFVSPSFIPPSAARRFLPPAAAAEERPGRAARQLARALNAPRCRTVGINWFCCGYSRALALVSKRWAPRLALGRDEYLLVVVATRISRITNFACRQTGGLFGDMASATLIAPATRRANADETNTSKEKATVLGVSRGGILPREDCLGLAERRRHDGFHLDEHAGDHLVHGLDHEPGDLGRVGLAVGAERDLDHDLVVHERHDPVAGPEQFPEGQEATVGRDRLEDGVAARGRPGGRPDAASCGHDGGFVKVAPDCPLQFNRRLAAAELGGESLPLRVISRNDVSEPLGRSPEIGERLGRVRLPRAGAGVGVAEHFEEHAADPAGGQVGVVFIHMSPAAILVKRSGREPQVLGDFEADIHVAEFGVLSEESGQFPR